MKGIKGLFEERENVVLSCPFLVQVLHVDGWYLERMVNFSSMILCQQWCFVLHILAFHLK